ncbi:STAS domain-containing protein [Candidatus Sororendozoicomonas aggregata]|uniref:STAS domain-containing protein n=1 Tax=Candidatus Sororendozoicomonas aggregata TaxID=3073239 RepID=UPI002ED371CF
MIPGKIQFAENQGTWLVKLCGEVRLTLCQALETFLEKVTSDPGFCSIIIDASEASTIDSTILGLLAKLSIKTQRLFSLMPVLISTRWDVTRLLLSMGFDKVFIIVEHMDKSVAFSMHDLACDISNDEQGTQQRVLDAHRTLMSLNDNNRKAFRDLVEQLERYADTHATPSSPGIKHCGTHGP